MSFNKLSQPAAMLLQLCSFLHHDGISEEIFSRAARYTFSSSGPSKEELEKPLQFLSQFLNPAGQWDSLCFLKVTNEIKAYSLFTFDPARKVFSIHPLVHSWSQTTIPDQQSYHSIMGAIVGMSIKEIPSHHRELASLQLISHIDSLMHANQQLAADFGLQCGMIYYYARRFEEAHKIFLAALEKQKNLGDDHPNTLWAMSRLASTYSNLGEFPKAEELRVVLVEKQKRVLGDGHPETLRTMGNLAHIYRRLGKFHKAEELGVVVLEKQKRVLGDDHPDTLYTMGTLASTYHKLREFHKADKLGVVVLEKRKKVLGDDHPDTLFTMGHLASTYHSLGELHKAEELGVVVLEKRKRVLGDDHPDTLWTMGHLASTYHNLGGFHKAEELGVVVLEKQKKGSWR
jgi:tetratricopeptide (TPR) repeat protein